MHLPRSLYAALVTFLTFIAPAQSPQKPDAATAAWWTQTTALSNVSMKGRDSGTEAYERAAKYVAEQFQAAGLKPAGDNGTFFQRVPMHQIDLDNDKSSVDIVNTAGKSTTLHFPTDVTTVPREQPSVIEAPMIFLGYGMPPQISTSRERSPSSPPPPPLLWPQPAAQPTPAAVLAPSLKQALPPSSPSTIQPPSSLSTGPPPTLAASPSPERKRPTPTLPSSSASTP